MDDVLKQRLVGAAVLIALAVIFVPMLFDAPRDERLERQLDPAIPRSPQADEDIRRLPLNPDATRSNTNETSAPAPADAPARDDGELARTDGVGEAPAQRMPIRSAEQTPAAPSSNEQDGANADAAEDEAAEREAPTGEQAPVSSDRAASGEPPGEQSMDGNAAGEAVAVVEWGQAWRVQVASFGSEATAQEIRDALIERGHDARIERIERGDSVLHRIQAGPYDDREAAEVAMQAIGEQIAGVSPVVRAPAASGGAADVTPGYAVQVGSFTSEDNAERMHAQLLGEGFDAFYFAEQMGSREIWRVRVGTVAERGQAEALLARLRAEAELEGLVVSHP